MEAYILNQEFKRIGIVDVYESFIWTDRFQAAGDFEVYCYPSEEILEKAKRDHYLENPESEHLMIIESIEITTDTEDGDRMIIKGRSLESILDRRIVWTQTTLDGNFQNEMKRLIRANIISPKVRGRKIDNFVFVDSTDPEIKKLTIDTQYMGDSLYDIICDQCKTNRIGFRVLLDADLRFVFSFYKGTDRSYSQTNNPYVIFSPSFENIINSRYLESAENYKNVALVLGTDDVTTVVGTEKGILRREVCINASDVSSTEDMEEPEEGAEVTQTGEEIDPEEYEALLKSDGKKQLEKRKVEISLEGEVDTTRTFLYGRDFFLGDRVQVENGYNKTESSLVSEIIWSQEKDGFKCYPTFIPKSEEDKSIEENE